MDEYMRRVFKGKEYIPLDKCVDKHLYRIQARNGTFGVFNKEQNAFTLAREKFGNIYLFDEYHYDTGAPFGTVFPTEDLGELQLTGNDLLKHLKGLQRESMRKSLDVFLASGMIDEERYRKMMKVWE